MTQMATGNFERFIQFLALMFHGHMFDVFTEICFRGKYVLTGIRFHEHTPPSA